MKYILVIMIFTTGERPGKSFDVEVSSFEECKKIAEIQRIPYGDGAVLCYPKND